MEKNYTLGKKIKDAREKKGLNQKDFAGLLNVSQASVSKYESGENVPRMNKLREISSILEVPLSYFLDESESQISQDDLSQERKKEIINVIQEFWVGLGSKGGKDAVMDEPLIRFCISKIHEGSYDTAQQLKIIRFLKSIEEIFFTK